MVANLLDILTSFAFFVGVIAGATGYWVACKIGDALHNRRHGTKHQTRIKPTWAVGGLVLIFIAYSAVSTYEHGKTAEQAQEIAVQTSGEAKAIADENRECQRQFFEALTYRAGITSTNDDLTLQRFEILADWLHDIIFPPPDIARLDENDPVRMRWQIDRTAVADQSVRALIDEQNRNEAERAAKPYPEPTCGR